MESCEVVYVMQGIFVMGIITTLLSIGIIGGIICKKSKGEDRETLLMTFLLGIPVFFFAYYLLRLPLDFFLKNILSNYAGTYIFFQSFYAPLTEELSKLLVIVLPFIYRRTQKSNLHFFAFATGLGFGVGEIWFLANILSQNPKTATLPWYFFTGFLTERFLVCFLHGSFVLVALHYLLKNHYRGVLYAMLLHWLVNLPIFIGFLLNLTHNMFWQIFLSQWTFIFSFIMISITTIILYGKLKLGYFLAGQAKCPECAKIYDRPFLGVSLISKKYEKCPHCKKWHWIRKSVKEEGR